MTSARDHTPSSHDGAERAAAPRARGTPRGPRRLSQPELARVGIHIRDWSLTLLVCDTCGECWSPTVGRGGRLPRGYWRCPNRCNEPH
jgi:hypothetical protein